MYSHLTVQLNSLGHFPAAAASLHAVAKEVERKELGLPREASEHDLQGARRKDTVSYLIAVLQRRGKAGLAFVRRTLAYVYVAFGQEEFNETATLLAEQAQGQIGLRLAVEHDGNGDVIAIAEVNQLTGNELSIIALP